ncbi:hypothetical protein Goarm_007598 [Gossypium armourianum]|uniref:Uncharacterized protein n=1 Tax=Gossypium armourianum TaxID=34283 RepID=A0A7J9JMC1_9ROSI|nr:hypothetical protein [Gossypium armourianum]
MRKPLNLKAVEAVQRFFTVKVHWTVTFHNKN